MPKPTPTGTDYPFVPFLTVEIKTGHITLDRRKEVLQDATLSGETPFHPWTSLQDDGWRWEEVGPGDRRLEPEVIPFES